MPAKVLIITSLFAVPWNDTFAAYNQTQFGLLSQQMDVSILVPISCISFIKNPLAYWRFKRQMAKRWPNVDYVVFWHGPSVSHFSYPVFLLLSLMLQRFPTLFLKRWDCLLGSWGFPDSVTTVIIGKLTHTPVVVQVHGSDVNMFTFKLLHRVQIRWALNQSCAVIAVSKAMAVRLGQIGVDTKRTTVLYNGVDPLRFHLIDKHTARAEHGIGQDDEMILFVGVMLVAKGCAELLNAFSALAQRRPFAKLVYIGDGPLKKRLQAKADQLCLRDRVRFIGWVAHAELASWFSAASVFCLPSYAEGVPSVVLEAMACGTPVVATDVGGIGEVLPEFAGLLIPPHDIRALESALDLALDSPWDRQRTIDHTLVFDWAKNVKNLKEILEGAMQSVIWRK
jgi:glycosyltransferase involved in cell wall biosynthesis